VTRLLATTERCARCVLFAVVLLGGLAGRGLAQDGAPRADATEPVAPAEVPQLPEQTSPGQPAAEGMTAAAEAGPPAPPSVAEQHEAGLLQGVSLEDLLNMKVVTASGVAEDRALAPASVYVVTREDIDRRGYRSLAEVLSAVPGLYVIEDLVTPALSVRGISGGLRGGTRIVRIMIDGEVVSFRPDLTAFIGPEYIPMEAVERVEIAKGPLSALYGANAFLATVNVITRIPREGGTTELAGRGTRIHRPNSYGLSGAVGQRAGNTSFLAAFQTDFADRSGLRLQRTFPSQDLNPGLFGGESIADISRRAGGFAAFRTSAAWLGSLTVEGGLQHFETVGEFQLNSLYAEDSVLAIDNYWANARWDRPWLSQLATTLSLGWSQGKPKDETHLRLTDAPGIFYRPHYGYTAWDGRLEARWTPLASLAVTAGVDSELDFERVLYYSEIYSAPQGGHRAGDSIDISMGPNDAKGERFRDLGAYAQASYSPLPALRLGLNGRLDWIAQGDITFPVQTSWRGSGAYRFSPGLAAKILVGQAFQTPSAVLTYARPGFGNAGNLVGSAIISATLPVKPQTVTSAELGLTARIGTVLTVDTSVYYQSVRDSIQFFRYGSNFQAANNKNTLRNVGVEATIRCAVDRFSSYLNATLQSPRDKDGDFSTTPPEGYPNVFGTLGVDVDVPEARSRAHADVGWFSARGASQSNVYLNNGVPYTLRSYVRLNAVLSTANLRLLGKGAETRFLLRGQNLLDARGSEPGYGGFDLPMLGRIITVEARIAY
jgi:outer membrane receptor protein involved in Fe transport